MSRPQVRHLREQGGVDKCCTPHPCLQRRWQESLGSSFFVFFLESFYRPLAAAPTPLNPEDIYSLHNIIPKLEWAAMEAFISSKIRQMAAQSCMCYPTLVVIGY